MLNQRMNMKPMTRFVLRPDSIVRSTDLAGPVTEFKMRLVSAFCENNANAQI